MEYKRLALKDQAVDLDARTFQGYAATWDQDQVGDVIHRGAFAKSIKESFPKGRIKILWQHRDPIGLPTEMREDDTGLFVKGRVSKTALGDEALELMRDEVVDSMSIGFVVPMGKSEYDEAEGIRHIREVKLYEFSPVTFPANEAAIITGVKSLEEAIRYGRFENREPLMRALDNLKALISQAQPGQPTADDDEPLSPEAKEIIRLIRSMTHHMQG
jgi:HK97 family phage prohead protease